MWRCLWMFSTILAWVSGEYLMGGHLDNNAGIKLQPGKIENSSTSGHLDNLDLDFMTEDSTITTTSSISIEDDVLRYHIPYPFAFNGGKPFSLEKDPITGKIDFEKAPSVKILNYTSRYYEHKNKESENNVEEIRGEGNTYLEQEKVKSKEKDDVDSNEISTYVSNFHDFFNLPIHYSSDKYGNNMYPLISNSYANTKVQSGTNSYSMYNHRPYHPKNDFYAPPTKNSYTSMTKTNVYKTTTINNFKTKWKNSTSPLATTISLTTATPSKVLSTSTIAPIITTWKPFPTLTTLPSINYMITKEENEKNILPLKTLEASNHIEANKNLNISAQSLNDRAIEKTNTKNQSNLDNFVLSHAGTQIKISMQNEEYKDFYDTYESPEDEDNGEDDSDGDIKNSDRDIIDKKEESDYFLPFQDILKKDLTSTLSTTSNVMASTETTTINAITLSTGTTSISTTPSGFVSPTLFTSQEDTFASNSLQFPITMQYPIVSSSLNNDRIQSNIEHHYNMSSHEYKSTSTIKSEQNKTDAEIVIESTSNIIIPPDHDTVSFVLGNHQNVDGDYYSVETNTEENSYSSFLNIDTSFRPLRDNIYDPIKEVKYEHSSSITKQDNSDRINQKWWPPNSSALKNNHEFEPTRSQNSFLVTSSAAIEDTNNRSKEQDFTYVFPNTEMKDEDAMTEERTVIINEADSIHELPSKTTLTMMKTMTNKTKLNSSMFDVNENLPQLAENLMPPAENSILPSYYYHYQHNMLRSNHSRPQKLLLPPHIKPHSGPLISPLNIGLKRRPYSPNTKLPNILPQFRPNAKASYGHRFGSDVIGTMLAGQNLSTRTRQPLQNHPPRSSFPLPPSYLQRLYPPPPPIHAVKVAFVSTSKMDNFALPLETKPTIRKFHLPHTSSILHGDLKENTLSNKLFDHNTNQNESENDGINSVKNKKQVRDKNEIVGENRSSERYPEESSITPPRPPLFPKRRTADSPRVTTLQMIQHHGEFGDNEIQLARPVGSVLAHQMKHRKPDNQFDSTEIDERPIYVVYPVNTAVNIHPDDSNEKDGSVVVGTRGPHRPLPPDTLLQDERKKIHTVYNSRPIAVDFPYPLERPDLSSMLPATVKETPLLIPSDQRQQISSAITSEQENQQAKNQQAKNQQNTINMIPYLQDFLPYQKKDNAAISVTLQRTTPISTSTSTSTLSTLTSTPIAYVYTPIQVIVHPTQRLNDTNIAANIDTTATVLLPSQQPSSSSSSAPAPQNFMAPFVASISAETPTKNDWSVIVIEPSSETDKRLNSDSDDAKLLRTEVDTQTEKNEFDVDNFKPQLFGGFQPIYEFPNEDGNMEHHIVNDAKTLIINTDTETDSKELFISDKE